METEFSFIKKREGVWGVVVKLTLEFRDVAALLSNESRSLSSILVDIPVRISVALAAARWKDSAMVVGWIPFLPQDFLKRCEREEKGGGE
jgi:hypothetical protein